jgi:hypothetical protein
MSIDYHQSLLASISSQNPDVNAVAQQVNQYTEMCKSGQITTSEYVMLLNDIQSQINIQAHMAELDAMEKLNTAINGLINIASAV